MIKKHKKEIAISLGAPVVLVLLLLILVVAFEYFQIHVPGSREMWIGLIGAVIGGAFTLIGVLITIYKQEDAEEEKRRMENMPILVFEPCRNQKEANTTYSYCDGEMITSGFGIYENKEWMTVKIKTANNAMAFDFEPIEIIIDGKSVTLGSAWNPTKERIVMGCETSFAIDISLESRANIFCVIRYKYSDLFGNQYYQDLPLIYSERSQVGPLGTKRSKQWIEIRDIKPPIYIKEGYTEHNIDITCFSDYEDRGNKRNEKKMEAQEKCIQ